MRISDWSSDVCSSDLLELFPGLRVAVKDRYPVAAFALGAVQRLVGVREQLGQVVTRQRGRGHAEAGGDQEPVAAGLGVDAGDTHAAVLGHALCPAQVAARQQNRELLAAQDRKSTRLNSSH